MSEEGKKALIVLFNGTVDALQMMASLAWGLTAMGVHVYIFLQTWGVWAFLKGNPEKLNHLDPNARWSSDYKDLVPEVIENMKKAGTANWYELLKDMKEDGMLTIYSCSTAAQQFGVKSKDGFDEIVDDITGVVEAAQLAEECDIFYYV